MRRRNIAIARVGAFLLAIGGFAYATRSEGSSRPLSPATPIYWIRSATASSLYEPARQVWKRGVPDKNEVCLTFDDGPHVSSPAILDALKSHGVKATFFVVGRMVETRPEEVRRMLAEGHEVGNHTYDHRRLDALSPEQIHLELAACEAAVERAAKVRMTLMRPPGMRLNDSVIAENRRFGYTLVDWTIGAKDFIGNIPTDQLPKSLQSEPNATPEIVRERVAKQLKNGAIILLHDNPVTAAALPGILDDLKAKGYVVKTAREMMAELPQSVEMVANPPLLGKPLVSSLPDPAPKPSLKKAPAAPSAPEGKKPAEPKASTPKKR